MTTPAWFNSLTALKACPFGLKLASRYANFQELWDDLDRGDWMMWALGHGTNVDDAVFAACTKEYMAGMPYEHGPHEEQLKTWKQLAEVVRRHFPKPPELPT